MHTTLAFRRIMRLGLIPTLLTGLWIGHLTAAGTDTIELQSNSNASTFSHFGYQWSSVGPQLADSLSESGLPKADSRVWENCAIRTGSRIHSKLRIVCPDGYMVSLSN